MLKIVDVSRICFRCVEEQIELTDDEKAQNCRITDYNLFMDFPDCCIPEIVCPGDK